LGKSMLIPKLCSFVAALGCLFCIAAAAAQISPQDAEPATRAAQERVASGLPLQDRTDFEDAMYGFVGTIPDAETKVDGNRSVWSMKPYEFIQGPAPATVNPSLWRQAQLNNIHGLFKITDRIYQVRGLDSANMTLVEGDTSLIVIDTLTTAETARAALDLYFKHRPKKPIHTVILTHSHADHFGGVKGVVSEEDVASGKVQLLAPAGFLESAIGENVIAGTAMNRRGAFQFGLSLTPGPRGAVDEGTGKTAPHGTVTLLRPTATISKNMDRRNIDGIEIVFQLAPGAEAPAEMHMYFPQFQVLDMAEDVVHSMHNVYAIRGAVVRDANLWSRYLNDAIEAFGKDATVLIAQHQWPVRGNDRVVTLLKQNRDMYKFIHDQSLRLINLGYTPDEISEALRMPASLSKAFATREYYGTLSVNAKAVYQKYMGWYDANPANLNPLPPVEASRKAVEYMGGADAVIARAREDFKKGNYRWVASVMSQVVFADPNNRTARELCAEAFEQLGYQAESALWRNAYLVGALELRNGTPKPRGSASLTPGMLKAVSVEQYFDLLGIRLNPAKADGKRIQINWVFTDLGSRYVLNLENSALTYVVGENSPTADVALTMSRATLDGIILNRTTFENAIQSGAIQTQGDPRKLTDLMSLLDNFSPSFEVVEPKRQ
jgi:alkyl sulfatase BDS1-like metallo-beta-lactamase superfamily hydrolase